MHINELILQMELLTTQVKQPLLLGTLKDKVVRAGSLLALEMLSTCMQNTIDMNLLADRLRAFLQDYWEKYQGTPLAYTCIPHFPLTSFCARIAVWIHEFSPARYPNPLALMMPNLQFQASRSDDRDYPSLIPPTKDVLAWVKEVIATHITSTKRRCLLPVRQLSVIEANAPAVFKLNNPYADTTSTDEAIYFISSTDEDYKKLIQHSSSTRAISDAKTHIDTAINENSNLLAHLYLLSRLLYLYSAQGLGKEKEAAGGAYPAILRFREYYDKLSPDIRQTIPGAVKTNVDALLGLAFNLEKNTQASAFATCIATWREHIVQSIAGNEKALSDINLPEAQQQDTLLQAQAQFRAAQKNLRDRLDHQTYDLVATDTGVINMELLEYLGIPLFFSSENDTAMLFVLSPNEISSFFSHEFVKDAFLKYLMQDGTAIEKLRILCGKLSGEQIISLLTPLAQEIGPKVIQSPIGLAHLLISLNLEKNEAIYRALETQLSELIPRAKDLNNLLYMLPPERGTVLLRALHAQLPGLVQHAGHFIVILYCIPLEQRQLIFDAFKARLLNLVESADDLSIILNALYPEQRTVVFDTFKALDNFEERLSKLVESADDLGNLLYYLLPEQCTVILEALTSRLPDLVNHTDKLFELLEAFSPEQRGLFVIALKTQLPGFIGEDNNLLEKLYTLLPLEQCEIISSEFIRQGTASERLFQLNNGVVGDFLKNTALFKQTSIEITQVAKSQLASLQESPSDPLRDKTPGNVK